MPDDVDTHGSGTNVERSVQGRPSLEERARRYAALGEPVRLAIIDHLTLGDASPGELGSVVDLPTNLLAHHLRVLLEAGLIRRVRSEGDRRRSYVQLRWDDAVVAWLLSAWVTCPNGTVQRVMFDCTHNSIRSQLAAAAWARATPFPVACAGTHPAERVHPRTHRLVDVALPGDLIVAVCDNAHEELVAAPPSPAREASLPSRAGQAVGRAWLPWAVPDPARLDTDEAFETAYLDLSHRIDR